MDSDFETEQAAATDNVLPTETPAETKRKGPGYFVASAPKYFDTKRAAENYLTEHGLGDGDVIIRGFYVLVEQQKSYRIG